MMLQPCYIVNWTCAAEHWLAAQWLEQMARVDAINQGISPGSALCGGQRARDLEPLRAKSGLRQKGSDLKRSTPNGKPSYLHPFMDCCSISYPLTQKYRKVGFAQARINDQGCRQ